MSRNMLLASSSDRVPESASIRRTVESCFFGSSRPRSLPGISSRSALSRTLTVALVEREIVLRERREPRARVAERRIGLHPVAGDGQQRGGRADARQRADDPVEQLLHLAGRILRRVVAQQRRLEFRQARGQQLHRGLGLDQAERRRRFLDDVDVLPRLRRLCVSASISRSIASSDSRGMRCRR